MTAIRTWRTRPDDTRPSRDQDAATSAFGTEPIAGVLDVVLDDYDEAVAVVRGISGQPWVLVPQDEPERLPWRAVTAARLGFDLDGQLLCFAATATGIRVAVRQGLSWVEASLELPGAFTDVATVLFGTRIVLALASTTGASVAALDSLDEPPKGLTVLGSTPCAAVSAVLDTRGRIQVAFTDTYGLNLLATTIMSKPDGALIASPLATHPITTSAASSGSLGRDA